VKAPFRVARLVVLMLLVLSRPAAAFSVLTHEAIIDAVWDDQIAPLLRARYHPSARQLRDARAYAYGGCIIQDMGYYPFSSRTFGDLVHYVRSGDFIQALLKEAKDANEYAFALGALAHWAADNHGHPEAINRSVPLLYPKLRAKFGDHITYEDNPSAHLKTEFAFDVVQVARGAYAPQAYHDFIGFEVAKPLLERAFRDTYGVELKDLFMNMDLAIGTFRHSVSAMIPSMTKVAWSTREKEIARLTPGVTREQFLFVMPQQKYEEEWGTKYSRPNTGHRILGGLFKVVPKIGPLRSLEFHMPTPEAEQYFLRSVESTVRQYRNLLAAVASGRLSLPNRNFDTGGPVTPGTYRLVDEVYAKLLEKLAHRHFEGVPAALRADILAFYRPSDAPIATKHDRHAWRAVLDNLEQLKAVTPGSSER
jgi:hypothetical protein